MLVIVARKYSKVIEHFFDSIYKETKEKHNLKFISNIEMLNMILSEHTYKNSATPMLVFLGRYLSTDSNESQSTEDILFYLRKRKKTIVIEYSVNITHLDIDKLQIPDKENPFELIYRIIEIENLEGIVKRKKISIFKRKFAEIVDNLSDITNDLIINNTTNNHP